MNNIKDALRSFGERLFIRGIRFFEKKIRIEKNIRKGIDNYIDRDIMAERTGDKVAQHTSDHNRWWTDEKNGWDYVAFFESTGAEYVDKCFNMFYFRRKSDMGEFELYSDNESRLKHLDGMAIGVTAMLMMNLIIGILNTLVIPGASKFAIVSLAAAAP